MIVSSLLSLKYPARQNVAKLLAKLKSTSSDLIYLQGNVSRLRHNTDMDVPFRQESNFFYLTGVDQPGYHLVIDIKNQKSILFAPKIHNDEIMWIGEPASLAAQKETFDVDEIKYSDELIGTIDQLAPSTIHTINEVFDNHEIKKYENVNTECLKRALEECRLIKSEFELSLMKEANRISCEAHVILMKKAVSGMNERELHAEFAYHCHKLGSSGLGYIPIVGSGKNGAILHYQKNSSDIKNPGELVLVDAGCDFRYYAADITRTFPAGGKFTPEGKAVYSLVLKMQKAVFAELKEGVEWEDMHRLAMKVASQGLFELGVLQGSPEEALKSGAVAVFFPHGLGHSIGLDVHDVGGYPEGVERIQEPGIRYLRMRRKLMAGMVVTVEPGIYFAPPIIDSARSDASLKPFINFNIVDSLIHVGGVRIEDSVVITPNGYENLTPLIKEVEDVEANYKDQ